MVEGEKIISNQLINNLENILKLWKKYGQNYQNFSKNQELFRNFPFIIKERGFKKKRRKKKKQRLYPFFEDSLVGEHLKSRRMEYEL